MELVDCSVMRGRRGARGKELLSRMARVEKQSDQGLKEPAGQGTAWNLKRKREQSDGDGSLREICENLKCLIVVINNFSQRRRPAAIDRQELKIWGIKLTQCLLMSLRVQCDGTYSKHDGTSLLQGNPHCY